MMTVTVTMTSKTMITMMIMMKSMRITLRMRTLTIKMMTMTIKMMTMTIKMMTMTMTLVMKDVDVNNVRRNKQKITTSTQRIVW